MILIRKAICQAIYLGKKLIDYQHLFLLFNTIDKNVLSNILVKISHIPLEYKSITELDINPLIANGSSIKAVDARMVAD